ncbi:hypothetical protein Golomagni_08046 [Golovinomyces magnicellulatus]|nr:hypothetical protein Golomagni_08046 [Golovinomyces magnicellulatus]
MLQSGSWKTAPFKKYNFDAEGAVPASGALHPLLKVREEFRNIFFEMGFTEMATDRFVESSFWCFDSLFVPQQHPARDVQDTFFIKDPPYAKHIPEDYLKRVTQVHQEGGFGSGDREARAAHPHHGGEFGHAVQARQPARWIQARQALLHRPRLPQRGGRRYASRRVPPGRGRRGRLRHHPRRPHRLHGGLFQKDGRHQPQVQAGLQSLYRALARDLLLPPGPQQVGRGGQLGHVQARDVEANGAARGRQRARLGSQSRTPHHDPICGQGYP